MMPRIQFLGLLPYAEALQQMEAVHQQICTDTQHEGSLLVLQHPPTVTMGNRPLVQHLKADPQDLLNQGVGFHKTDRGGSLTVHEPGQIVIYPIIPLERVGHTVRSFVCALEQAMIETCESWGVAAGRDGANAGVWVGANKIGAVGIRVSHKVTKHGLAFNVNNDLKTFSHIVPCGLYERGVTSLQAECQKQRPSGVSLGDMPPSTVNAPFFAQAEQYLAQAVERHVWARKAVCKE